MSEMEVREKILSLNQLQAQQERVVHVLIQQMIDMDMDSFEKTVNEYISSKGIERTITQIIFPFLEKIGILWLTNHINPAQEHLVSNIVRQKLIAGIEAVQTPLKSNKKILLFLPEGEYHELGLLFMYYLLKTRGINVIYVGASVPLKDVEYVVNYKKPDYLYSHLTTVGQNFNFERFLQNVTEKFSPIPIVISGQLTTTYEKKIPSSINFKRSFAEVMEFIMAL
jgi:methanogenic corrinoid protein MtbC1